MLQGISYTVNTDDTGKNAQVFIQRSDNKCYMILMTDILLYGRTQLYRLCNNILLTISYTLDFGLPPRYTSK